MEQATLESINQIVLFMAPHPLNNPAFVQDYDEMHVKLAMKLFDVPIPLDKAEVKASAIHGQGVFAKQKINKGELITIYPAHSISIHPGGHSNPGVLGLLKSDLAEERELEFTKTIRKCYAFDVNQHYVIYGHPDLTDNPAFLGHMINDGAKGHSTKTVHNQKYMMLYAKVSLALRNAKFELIGGLCVGVVATKEINIGDEVLVTYDYPYWISVNTK